MQPGNPNSWGPRTSNNALANGSHRLASFTRNANDMNAVPVSLDVLMERIREELERLRTHDISPKSQVGAHKLENSAATVLAIPAPSEEPSRPIRVRLDLKFPSADVAWARDETSCEPRYAELSKYDDEAFIRVAYRSVLGREPDSDGMSCYLAMLQDGASKAEILGRLRRSPEGKERGAKIKGLAIPCAIDAVSHWPILGSVVRLSTALWRLPGWERSDRRKLVALRRRVAGVESRIEIACAVSHDALRLVEHTLNALGGRLSAVDRTARSLRRALDVLQRAVTEKADSKPLAVRLNELSVSLQSKADHAKFAGLLKEFETDLQRKIDREALDALKATLQHKADREALDALKTTLQHKADRVSLDALKTITDATATSLDHERTAIAAAIDTLRRDKADVAVLDKTHRQLLLVLETRVERHELTALSNYIAEGLRQRASVEEIRSILAALGAVKEQVTNLVNCKADIGELERLDACMDERMATIRHELTSLRAQATDAQGKLADDLASIQPRLQTVVEDKADRTDIAALSQTLATTVERLAQTGQEELSATRDSLENKLDRATEALMLDTQRVRSEIAGEFRSELGRLQESLRALDAAKIERAWIDVLKEETAAALKARETEISERFRRELASTNSRTQELKLSYLDQERRLQLLLEEARKRLPHPMSLQQVEALVAEQEHSLAAMYASFEDLFRGTREDIKSRQSIYLEHIQNAKAGTQTRPVLDIGCGRGEWLELLRDNGLVARGVDSNRVFLARCRDLELEVIEEDAIQFLRHCKPNSAGAITSFHLIEHLSNIRLIALLDEALRVLRSGGILILETPNPRNLTVGACSFYLDPTHVRPLPPEYSRFLVEARGFVSVEVKELHPCPPDELVSEGAPRVNETLNRYLFSARDYAVIARKA
jgi:SAM-dependent methyltransferase